MAIAESVEVRSSSGRASSLFRESGAGFHQCWYPVHLSENLAAGEVVGIELGDGRVALYRTEAGELHAMVPYCKHMGSDLSVGEVVGDQLRCAFHHWHYGPDGVCSKIPSGDRIPSAARLQTFPVAERNGVIWIFWGPEPLYAVPDFAGLDPDKEMASLAFEIDFREICAVPPWVFTANIYDIVHNRVVHGIQIGNPEIEHLDDYHTRFSWDAHLQERTEGQQGAWRTQITVFGTNGIATIGHMYDRETHHLAFSAPMGSGGTRMFMVVSTEATDGADEHLEHLKSTHNQIVNEDLPILNTLRMGDDHLVAADRALAGYLRYARDYPRLTFAEIEATPRPS
jgi:phenylpropionate dioxygenase-like ring-hydroxylating dioxygenase large terminal subunit